MSDQWLLFGFYYRDVGPVENTRLSSARTGVPAQCVFRLVETQKQTPLRRTDQKCNLNYVTLLNNYYWAACVTLRLGLLWLTNACFWLRFKEYPSAHPALRFWNNC